MADVSKRAPTGRRISMKVLADKFNQHLPPHRTAYEFSQRNFIEKRIPQADDSIATLQARYPDSDYS